MERTYTIPLRKEWLKVPRYKRAKKAVTAVKQFLAKHMKSDDVRIFPELNMALWADGIKNPPARIKITTVKNDKGTVFAQIFGKKIVMEEEKKEGKKAKKEEKTEEKTEKKTVEKAAEKPAKEKKETVKEEPAKETKKEEAEKKEKTPAQTVKERAEAPKEQEAATEDVKKKEASMPQDKTTKVEK